MRFSDYIGYSVTHLRNKKGRSFLTILGVALSVMAMVSIVAIAQGFGEAIDRALKAQFSTDTLVVVDPLNQYKITLNDVSKLKEYLKGANVLRISPVHLFTANINTGGRSELTLVAGVNFSDIRNIWPILYTAIDGDLPTTDWNDNSTVVVGYSLANKLNIKANDIITITFNYKYNGTDVFTQKTFKVRAVLANSGFNLVGVDVDSAVLMNILLSLELANPPGEKNKISLILVQFKDQKYALDQQNEIQEGLYAGKVRAVAFAAYARAIENVVLLFNSMLLALIIIAVVIAGVGVMNTMFTSVRERIKEIGTNRAVGAKASEILSLFLTEAILIGVLGLILGTLMGIVAVFIIDYSNILQSTINLGGVLQIKASPKIIFEQILVWNLIVLIATIGFSFLPSRRASKVEPIIALRYE